MYNQQEINQYLKRIEWKGPVGCDLDTLNRILRAHYQHIPYENLDVIQGKPLSLDEKALFEKLILKRRGGWCFELNQALGTLLMGLGYEVKHLAARFLMGEPAGQVPMRRHHLLAVHLSEGDYLCDVGVMREASRIALRLKCGINQFDGVAHYRIERDADGGFVVYQRLQEKDFLPLMSFTMEKQVWTDFIMPNFYCEKHPDCLLNKQIMVGIHTESGSFNLVGTRLKRLEYGKVVETVDVAPEQLSAVLKQSFGIELP